MKALVSAFVIVLAAVAAGTLWVLRPSTPQAPTPRDQAQAAALISRLTVPAAAVSDPTATACGIPTRFCVSSQAQTHLDLFDGTLRQLQAMGARVTEQKCPTGLLLTGQCLARVSYRGGVLSVMAGDTSSAGAIMTSWAAVAGSTDRPVASHRPLVSDPAALGVVPAGWRGGLSCSKRAYGGCTDYQGTFVLESTRQLAAQALQTQLSTAGCRLSSQVDRAGTAKQGGSTLLAASRFRSAGGTDQVLVLVTVRDAGDFTQVTIYVSAV